jgi:hypothetical protein
MSATLVGLVKSARVVAGDKDGQHWEFLSLDVVDTAYGFVWSCQVRDSEEEYAGLIKQKLEGHQVSLVVKGQSASPRTLKDNRTIYQIRSQVCRVKDLGLPKEGMS